jgi:hypothetical protein
MGDTFEANRWLVNMDIKKNFSRVAALTLPTLLLSGCLGSATLDTECRTNTDCDASWGEYCYLPQDCDPAAIVGQCKLKPTQGQCSQLPQYPVCGCNQQEYRNLCWAAQARQSVVYYGTCAVAGPGLPWPIVQSLTNHPVYLRLPKIVDTAEE